MDEIDYKGYEEVGRATRSALEYGRNLIKEGAKLIDVAEKIEKYIEEKGFTFAFPVNISLDQEAAHYTPMEGDPKVFGKNLIKLDLGARKGEYLGDSAISIDLSGEHGDLVECSEEAAKEAISLVKAGRSVREIGRAVEEVAKKKGFNPIQNLGGHGITKNELHANKFIPNFDNRDETKLEEGEVIAIEVFVTTGKGFVEDGDYVQIFRKYPGMPRSPIAREVSSFIDSNFGNYPFAMRWVIKKFGEFKAKASLTELSRAGLLEAYPLLVERSKGIVAQTEYEMIVEKDSCKLIT
ncbi:MAG: type II methionyl aminopeptidase [Candidatus Micrarchaeia archaeon]|jgi:methionyl aminopeptidase